MNHSTVIYQLILLRHKSPVLSVARFIPENNTSYRQTAFIGTHPLLSMVDTFLTALNAIGPLDLFHEGKCSIKRNFAWPNDAV
jgi:hypothetical protein